ncbi:faciogenital dysplasia protein [Anaeramoeba flamelloides]|uniref:Faciogenital dysplasia protein n=1 Tax=Anaeramoeba flamelloides TaxID=1746091 RepID=A0ABQ8YVP5_9EUKA|nr:faciogenital dysplasia protein [Anaeramoeba flamelloides]
MNDKEKINEKQPKEETKKRKQKIKKIQTKLRVYLATKHYHKTKITTQIQKTFRRFLTEKRYPRILRRKYLIKELYETEKTYLNYLHLLSEFEKELKKEGILTRKELKILFGGLKEICEFNEIFFGELEKITSKWNLKSKIGEWFVSLIPYMGIYTPYINDYEIKAASLSKYKKQYPKFSYYVEKIKTDQRSRNLSLESMIIMPIQRLPRYVLLMESLSKVSSQEEQEKMSEAAITIKSITEKINEKKRGYEQMMAILEIDHLLTKKGQFSLVTPSRYFIDKVVVNFAKNSTFLKTILFLFNDIILIAFIENSFWSRTDFSYSLQGIMGIYRLVSINNLKEYENEYHWSLENKTRLFYFVIKKDEKNIQERLSDTKRFIHNLQMAKKNRVELINSRKQSLNPKRGISNNFELMHEKINFACLSRDDVTEKKNIRKIPCVTKKTEYLSQRIQQITIKKKQMEKFEIIPKKNVIINEINNKNLQLELNQKIINDQLRHKSKTTSKDTILIINQKKNNDGKGKEMMEKKENEEEKEEEKDEEKEKEKEMEMVEKEGKKEKEKEKEKNKNLNINNSCQLNEKEKKGGMERKIENKTETDNENVKNNRNKGFGSSFPSWEITDVSDLRENSSNNNQNIETNDWIFGEELHSDIIDKNSLNKNHSVDIKIEEKINEIAEIGINNNNESEKNENINEENNLLEENNNDIEKNWVFIPSFSFFPNNN